MFAINLWTCVTITIYPFFLEKTDHIIHDEIEVKEDKLIESSAFETESFLHSNILIESTAQSSLQDTLANQKIVHVALPSALETESVLQSNIKIESTTQSNLQNTSANQKIVHRVPSSGINIKKPMAKLGIKTTNT